MMDSTKKLEMLVMVARLLSSKLDISDLLTTIMRLATRVVNSERASLYLLDEKTQELYFHIALDLDDEVKKIRLKLGEGVAGTCAKEARSIVINNVFNDQRHSKKVDEKSGYTTRSLLTCPMIIKGKVIGVVQAINKIDGDFDEDDLANFEAFASQAAIAIENARLFNGLKYEKSKLQTLFEMISEVVIVSDSNGIIKMHNSSVSTYFGITNPQRLSIKELLNGFKTEMDIDNVIQNKTRVEFLVEREHIKRLILKCVFIPKVFETHEKEIEEEFIWIFDDVTNEVIESRISREFLSLLSHKMRTPLTAISGFAQILQSFTGDERIQKAINSIILSSSKLNSIVDKMLKYSEIENRLPSDLKLEDVDVDVFMEETIEDAKKAYSDVEFEKDVIDRFSFRADKTLFGVLFKELISNSVKFNSKDRKKVIITSKIDREKKMILLWDNGNGIPPEEIGKVFDKFYQVEDGFTGQVEGIGLGLSIVKKIIELHNFDIKIKSKPSSHTLVLIDVSEH